MIQVRAVRPGEGARLRELRLSALKTDPDAFGSSLAAELDRPAAFWAQWAADPDIGTFVAVDAEDRWLGLALVRAAEPRQRAQLNAMWVAPAARRQGAATALCDACAQWAARRGFITLGLAVIVGNEPARRTYERAGFAFSHHATWNGIEELILRRPLRA